MAFGRTRSGVARAIVALGWVLLIAAAAGCSSLTGAASSGSPAPPRPTDRLHVQAFDALDRWAAAVRESGGASITFVGDLTSKIGEWVVDGGEQSVALEAGLVEAAKPLSDGTPSRGEVKWLDGMTVGVRLVSAADALADLVADADGEPCRGCVPLRVTDARLATGLIETSRGPAEAPTWVFTIEGSDVRITRVAVDGGVTVDPPPWNADDPPAGIRIESAIGEAASDELEVSFVGSPTDCGDVEYTAAAVESELAVVVIVTGRGTGCPDLRGQLRSARVELAEPLGKRAVLEVRQGLPVPVTAP